MGHSSDDARGTKRRPEDEGEREAAKRQDSMFVSSLREEELTRKDGRPRGVEDEREILRRKR